MKLSICLALTLVALTGCSVAPFSPQDNKTITTIEPTLPVIQIAVQREAAIEMASDVAPAENQIINACLAVVDQANILSK